MKTMWFIAGALIGAVMVPAAGLGMKEVEARKMVEVHTKAEMVRSLQATLGASARP